MHLQHEELSLAGEAPRQGHDVGDVLFGQDRSSGRDASHQRHSDCVSVLNARDPRGFGRGDECGGAGDICASVSAAGDDLHRPRAIGVSAHQPQALELVQLVLDGGGTGQTHLLTDLPQRGRIAMGGDGLADRLVDRPSALVEVVDGRGDGFGGVCAGARDRCR